MAVISRFASLSSMFVGSFLSYFLIRHSVCWPPCRSLDMSRDAVGGRAEPKDGLDPQFGAENHVSKLPVLQPANFTAWRTPTAERTSSELSVTVVLII